MVYGVIYKITNTINSKKYYGQTTQLLKRWSRHRANARNNVDGPLYNAIRLYGLDNFKFEVVCSCDTLAELNEMEEKNISDDNTCSPNGYNIQKGGNKHEHSEETCEKIRKKLTGRKLQPLSQERKEKIRNALIGHKVSDETKIKLREASLNMSDETREKMRQAKLGKKQSPEQIEKVRQRMLTYWALKKSEKNIIS
uniref:GIY-YIG domain-containing protein n=1 Tax=viral metagenome TaxID=1070528 RepID=A0A6C0AJM1_9ZZZZ